MLERENLSCPEVCCSYYVKEFRIEKKKKVVGLVVWWWQRCPSGFTFKWEIEPLDHRKASMTRLSSLGFWVSVLIVCLASCQDQYVILTNPFRIVLWKGNYGGLILVFSPSWEIWSKPGMFSLLMASVRGHGHLWRYLCCSLVREYQKVSNSGLNLLLIISCCIMELL